MNKFPVLTFALVMISIGLFSCASQYPLLYKKSFTETEALKNNCERNGIKSNIKSRADSLFSASSKLMDNGKESEAYQVMEHAFIHYRLALSADELMKTRKKNKELEELLSQARDKLDTYKKVLTEIESMKP